MWRRADATGTSSAAELKIDIHEVLAKFHRFGSCVMLLAILFKVYLAGGA
jgi:hypothetical protein